MRNAELRARWQCFPPELHPEHLHAVGHAQPADGDQILPVHFGAEKQAPGEARGLWPQVLRSVAPGASSVEETPVPDDCMGDGKLQDHCERTTRPTQMGRAQLSRNPSTGHRGVPSTAFMLCVMQCKNVIRAFLHAHSALLQMCHGAAQSVNMHRVHWTQRPWTFCVLYKDSGWAVRDCKCTRQVPRARHPSSARLREFTTF